MLKKFASILALAGLASGQAFAVSNLGFESGTTGWAASNGGSLTQVADLAAPMTVYNDYGGGDITTPYNIEAKDGAFFGLLDTNYNAPVTFAFNTGGNATMAGDTLWLRMFSAEYDFSAAAGGKYGLNDDFARVTYTSANGTVTDMLYSSDTSTYPDSGWKGFAIPVGTTGLSIALVDVNACTGNPTCGGFNAPKLGVDFTAVTPVPEPEMNLMMLAGLGVIGGLARRRMKKAA